MLDHILLHFEVASSLWNSISSLFRLNWITDGGFLSILERPDR